VITTISARRLAVVDLVDSDRSRPWAAVGAVAKMIDIARTVARVDELMWLVAEGDAALKDDGNVDALVDALVSRASANGATYEQNREADSQWCSHTMMIIKR